MRRKLWLALLSALIATCYAAASARAVTVTELGTFSSPVSMSAAPGDPHRMFVVEENGTISVLKDGVKLDQPFLDIPVCTVNSGESGLLGLAFAPDYATSGLFYVYYAALDNQCNSSGHNLVVEEFRRSTSDPDQADPTSGRIVFVIPHLDHPNHNGGELAFGPDGDLYMGPGDGSFPNDFLNSGQDLTSLLGKILRIDPRQSGSDPYTVPADNPFVGVSGDKPEIWAYGVRNPWRFSFDSLTGDLVIADVGESQREEVDFAPRSQGGGKGDNFGWSCWEGTLQDKTTSDGPCPALNQTAQPDFELQHAKPGPCAIIGGYVIRDEALGSLYGRYLFGDLCDGKLRTALLQGPNVPDIQLLGPTFASNQLVSFGQDDCDHLYAVDHTGPVYQINGGSYMPCPEPAPPQDNAQPSVTEPPAAAEAAAAPAPPAQARLIAERIWLGGAKLQHLLRNRSLTVAVACNQSCSVLATATIGLGSAARVVRLRGSLRSIAAGRRRVVKLRLSHRSRRLLGRVLRKGHRRTTVVVVNASYANGTNASTKRKVTVVR